MKIEQLALFIFLAILILNPEQGICQFGNAMTNSFADCRNDSLFVSKFSVNVFERKVSKFSELKIQENELVYSQILSTDTKVIGPIENGIFFNWYKVLNRNDSMETIEYIKLMALENYENNWSINFPAKPFCSLTRKVTNSMGTIDVQNYEYAADSSFLYYVVNSYRFPFSVRELMAQETGRQGFYTGKIGGFAYERGHKVIKVEDDLFGNYSGKKFEIHDQTGNLITHGRVFIIKGTVYFMAVTADKSIDREVADEFLKSFDAKY